ncbi:MAG TPA: hypothetical protein VMU84_03660 [Thermoanaerobaculia bacterium]|nr:hypothetical protein [Thermoanaerobaculia bacterium]
MTDLEKLRANALAKMDVAERWFKASIFGALLFEGIFTAGIIYFADVRDHTHMLICCVAGLIYMPIVLGLVALGAHVNRGILRVLTAIEDARQTPR